MRAERVVCIPRAREQSSPSSTSSSSSLFNTFLCIDVPLHRPQLGNYQYNTHQNAATSLQRTADDVHKPSTSSALVSSGSRSGPLDQNTPLGSSACQDGPGRAEVDASFGYEYIEGRNLLPQGAGVDAFHAESDVANETVSVYGNERESLKHLN